MSLQPTKGIDIENIFLENYPHQSGIYEYKDREVLYISVINSNESQRLTRIINRLT